MALPASPEASACARIWAVDRGTGASQRPSILPALRVACRNSPVGFDRQQNVKAITTRGGKTTQDPPYPDHVNRKKAIPVAEEPPREEEPEKVHEGKTAPHEFYDTQVLPFPMRARKPSTDE